MSFNIHGYKPKTGESEDEFLQRHEAEDDFVGEDFSDAELEKIDRLLTNEGFSKHQGEDIVTYEYEVLQISVYRNYIFMTVPYWDSAADSIDEAVRKSVLLYNEIGIFFYDPQMGNLITETNDDAMNTFNHTMETVKGLLPDDENS